jgi:LPS sulfotransferase NodH
MGPLPEPRAYIIAATPRCGSYFLCELLWNTNVCGHPSEYALPDARTGADSQASNEDYLQRYLVDGWTRNGVFGAKLMWEQYSQLAEDLSSSRPLSDPERHDVFLQGFGSCKFVRLRRRDKLRQAISYYRAIVTNEWHRTLNAARADRPIACNPDAIDQLVSDIAKQDARWEAFLDAAEPECLRLDYEDIQHDPEGAISTIFTFLGVTEPWQFTPGDLLKQADAVTERLIEEYQTVRDARSREAAIACAT